MNALGSTTECRPYVLEPCVGWSGVAKKECLYVVVDGTARSCCWNVLGC
jgi:hypothetical protein